MQRNFAHVHLLKFKNKSNGLEFRLILNRKSAIIHYIQVVPITSDEFLKYQTLHAIIYLLDQFLSKIKNEFSISKIKIEIHAKIFVQANFFLCFSVVHPLSVYILFEDLHLAFRSSPIGHNLRELFRYIQLITKVQKIRKGTKNNLAK